MKRRFRDVVNEVEYDDLVKIKDDISKGGHHLARLIREKIEELDRSELKVCATCGTLINPRFMDDFTLTFGRHDFKKRAYFCGMDCLRFFLARLERSEASKGKGEAPVTN